MEVTHAALPVLLALANILGGNQYPLSLKLGNLTPEWRQVTMTMKSDNSALTTMMMLRMSDGDLPAGQAPSVWYTKGDTATCGDVTFLVAYQAPRPPVDLSVRQERTRPRYRGEYIDPNAPQETPAPKLPPLLTAETVVTLSLVNLSSVSAINDVQPFDLQKLKHDAEVAGKAQAAELAKANLALSVNNLRQLAMATVMAMQDNLHEGLGHFPAMKTPEEFKAAVAEYAKARGQDEAPLFVNPITNHPYLPNPSLSGVSEAVVAQPAQMVVVYEDAPAADGTRGVGYADGHAERITEANWPKIKKASNIP